MICTDDKIYIGQRVDIDGTTKVDGALADATEVTVTVVAPDSTKSTFTLTGNTVERLSLGKYRALFTPSVSGRHQWRIESDGPVEGADQGYFDVQKLNV